MVIALTETRTRKEEAKRERGAEVLVKEEKSCEGFRDKTQ